MDSPFAFMRSRRISKRFIPVDWTSRRACTAGSLHREVFAEGTWPSIRVLLEARGWAPFHVERIHEHLRQGWPLAMAARQVSMQMGACPARSKFLG